MNIWKLIVAKKLEKILAKITTSGYHPAIYQPSPNF